MGEEEEGDEEGEREKRWREPCWVPRARIVGVEEEGQNPSMSRDRGREEEEGEGERG